MVGQPIVMPVVLLNAPFATVQMPSIALGLLKASLARESIEARVLHPNLWYAEEIGLARYWFLSMTQLFSEWVFSVAAFPDHAPDPSHLFAHPPGTARPLLELLRRSLRQDPLHLLEEARRDAARFVDKAADRVLSLSPRLVGCTSTYFQHCASLAILRRIRQKAPQVVTVMGGANCEGAMGQATVNAFEWVDFVVSGEADQAFGLFCRQVLEQGRDVERAALPVGVLVRGASPRAHVPRASVHDLDALPCPDYDDYFEEVRQSPLARQISPSLPVETARGCWWGVKHPCTFCAMNGEAMTYRAKRPERIVEELGALRERHGVTRFHVVDNVLSAGTIRKTMPILAQANPPYDLFVETRAHLPKQQVRLLAEGGVKWVVAGVESLHDRVLDAFDKGTRAATNVRFLKWAREVGMRAPWNLLFGAPGEEDGWYVEMAGWLPDLIHLEPPTSSPVVFFRFSPYHGHPERYGLRLSANPLYRLVYPLPDDALDDLAYYLHDERDDERFAYDEATGVSARPGLRAVLEALDAWQAAWQRNPPVLCGRPLEEGRLQVTDTRPVATASERVLDSASAAVLTACDEGATLEALREDRRLEGIDIGGEVAALQGLRLLACLGGIHQSLVVMSNH